MTTTAYPEPTAEHLDAARVAMAYTDAELAHEITLAACPSHECPEILRAALMVEAAARLRATARPATRPVWMVRYDQARRS